MNVPEFRYCMHCGSRLVPKYLKNEGMIPFCGTCGEYRFPMFNCGVSMIILNEAEDRILMIKQYGGQEYILVAGYVNKGEDAEDAAIREVKEEVGLNVVSCRFNHSHYYAPSNTLMLNYVVTVTGETKINEEVDSFAWFSLSEAKEKIRRNSLARAFLLGWLEGTFEFPDVPAPPYK